MAEITNHTPHTPCWAELASPDVEAAKRFYGSLFGWESEQVAGPEMGNYTFFKLRGKDVGGVGKTMMPGQPVVWMLYLASDNSDKTAQDIRAAGGAVLMEPVDIMDATRIGVSRDPSGAVFGVMQAKTHQGLGLMREPGALGWVELNTRDLAAAIPFYRQVFGWEDNTHPMDPGQPDYTEWKLNGESIGGAMMMPPGVPAEVPSHWLLYFQVENVDRSAEQVTQLGGRVAAGPMDFPGGRFAVVADPHGAVFGLLKMR